MCLLLVFQQCMKIVAWNFPWLLNNKTYISPPRFVEICLKMTKLCSFHQVNPPFLLVALWKVSVCSWWDEDPDHEMDRVTADPRNNHYWQKRRTLFFISCVRSNVLDALLLCSCGSTYQMACRATFNSSVVLGFSWSLWYFSSMASQTR